MQASVSHSSLCLSQSSRWWIFRRKNSCHGPAWKQTATYDISLVRSERIYSLTCSQSHSRNCSTLNTKSVFVSVSQRLNKPVTTASSGFHTAPLRLASQYLVFQTSEPLSPAGFSNRTLLRYWSVVACVTIDLLGSQNTSNIFSSATTSSFCCET